MPLDTSHLSHKTKHTCHWTCNANPDSSSSPNRTIMHAAKQQNMAEKLPNECDKQFKSLASKFPSSRSDCYDLWRTHLVNTVLKRSSNNTPVPVTHPRNHVTVLTGKGQVCTTMECLTPTLHSTRVIDVNHFKIQY